MLTDAVYDTASNATPDELTTVQEVTREFMQCIDGKFSCVPEQYHGEVRRLVSGDYSDIPAIALGVVRSNVMRAMQRLADAGRLEFYERMDDGDLAYRFTDNV